MAAPSKTVSPLVSFTVALFLSLSVMCGHVGVRVDVYSREIRIVTNGEGMHHLTPFLVCKPLINTNLKLEFSLRSICQLCCSLVIFKLFSLPMVACGTVTKTA